MERRLALRAGVSSLALIAISAAGVCSAKAQDVNTQVAQVETITVTGTNFIGVVPVGSSLTTVTTNDLQTAGGTSVTEMLSDVPALTGLNVPDRETGSNNGQPGSAIYIHDIGSNGDGVTLVLVDGHRAPLSGGINNFVNPNNIPSPMIQRVEMLTEGASAIYGSDAIAGVVNFITRSSFDGIQLSFNSDVVKGQPTEDVGLVSGQSWANGGFVFGMEYQSEPRLWNTGIWFSNPLAQPARALAAGLPVASQPSAVTNFGNFNCNPATIQPNGSGNIYLNAQSATNVANSAANQTCQQWSDATLYPSNQRIDAMLKVHENIGNLTISADLDAAHRQSTGNASAGVLTATAFGTGSQANPFYVDPPGVTATKQQIRYDFNGLFAPATSITGDSFINGTLDLNYKIDSDLIRDWSVDLLGEAGVDDSFLESYGGVNIGLATLALNGTAVSNGSTTTTALPGYNAVTLNLPLTTANALDVWDPVSSNKTSAATLASLTNDESSSHYYYATEQFRLSTQGTVFNLPAGGVKLAIGGEVFDQSTWQNVITPENDAGSNQASAYTDLNLKRGDLAEFLELDIPVISSDMNVPFMQKFDLDLAVRRDDYTDFGSTTNPKFAATWTINDDFSVRGNISSGFVAPQLALVGTGNGLAGFSTAGSTSLAVALPVSLYPTVTQFGIPGCTSSSVTCPINTLTGAVAHLGESPDVPMLGRSWNLGLDAHPSWFPDFTAGFTFWHTSLAKGTNSPSFNLSVETPALAGRVVLTPGCATQAQLNAFTLNGTIPLASPFPACTQFLEYQDANAYVTMRLDGLDAHMSYKYDTDFGTLMLTDSLSEALSAEEGFCKACTASTLFNILNTDGVNALDPTIGIQNRAQLGWILDAVEADFFVDWTSAYTDVATPVVPFQTNSVGSLIEGDGGDHVNAYLQYDLHLAYTFQTSWTGADIIGLTVKNLLNATPPYYNATTGYDPVAANPLGRTYTLNLTAKF